MSAVEVYVYDLSRGLSKIVSKPFMSQKVEGIWHTAVVVFGKEYFFGGDGISVIQPQTTSLKVPDKILDFGTTNKTRNEFEAFLMELEKDEFCGSKYHLLRHNCNNFTDRAAVYLTSRHIPEEILKLPEEIMSTPAANYLYPVIKGLTAGAKIGKLATIAAAGKVASKIVKLPIEEKLNKLACSGQDAQVKLKQKVSNLIADLSDSAESTNPDIPPTPPPSLASVTLPSEKTDTNSSNGTLNKSKYLVLCNEPLSATVRQLGTFKCVSNGSKSIVLQQLFTDLVQFANGNSKRSPTGQHFSLLKLAGESPPSIRYPLLDLFRVVLAHLEDTPATLLDEFTSSWTVTLKIIWSEMLKPSVELSQALMKIACNWIYRMVLAQKSIPEDLVKHLLELCCASLSGESDEVLMATKLAFNLTFALRVDKQKATDLAVLLLRLVLLENDGEEMQDIDAHDYAVRTLQNLYDVEQLVHLVAAKGSERDLFSQVTKYDLQKLLYADDIDLL